MIRVRTLIVVVLAVVVLFFLLLFSGVFGAFVGWQHPVIATQDNRVIVQATPDPIERARLMATAIIEDAERQVDRSLKEATIEALENENEELRSRLTQTSAPIVVLPETPTPLMTEAASTSTPTPTFTPTASIVEVTVCVVEDNSGLGSRNHRDEVVAKLQEVINDAPGVDGVAKGFVNYGATFQSTVCDFLVADYTIGGLSVGPTSVLAYRNGHPGQSLYVVGYSMLGSPNWTDDQISSGLINDIVRKPNLDNVESVFETWLGSFTS